MSIQQIVNTPLKVDEIIENGKILKLQPCSLQINSNQNGYGVMISCGNSSSAGILIQGKSITKENMNQGFKTTEKKNTKENDIILHALQSPFYKGTFDFPNENQVIFLSSSVTIKCSF